jgi:hypothetical protein
MAYVMLYAPVGTLTSPTAIPTSLDGFGIGTPSQAGGIWAINNMSGFSGMDAGTLYVVPEPSGVVLLAIGMTCCLAVRRRITAALATSSDGPVAVRTRSAPTWSMSHAVPPGPSRLTQVDPRHSLPLAAPQLGQATVAIISALFTIAPPAARPR